MTVTLEQLVAIMPTARSRIGKYLPYINRFLDEFHINTPKRLQHYLAQIAHESGELNNIEENLNYSADRLLVVFPKYFNRGNVSEYARNPKKIGNRVYANRMGNGNEASGDGYNYRGRGIIMLTGRSNYEAYKRYCGYDLIARPSLLAQPLGAVRSSMWFWEKSGCNILADADNIMQITKKINGGYIGLEERKKYLARAKKVIE